MTSLPLGAPRKEFPLAMTYELKPVHVATLPVPGWECFFGVNDVDFHDLFFYVWIVRGDGLVGIIDTGLPVDRADREALQDACQSVDKRCVFSGIRSMHDVYQAEGVSPEDVDFLLITQTLTYYTGDLLRTFFPNAKVYMSRAGFMELLLDTPGHPPRSFYFTAATWAFLRELLIEERLFLVSEPTEIAPGITFETTGGHHPGSGGIQIATPLGKVGILETAFLQRNVDDALPIGIAEDAAVCRRAIKRYKRECDLVIADHEPAVAERYRDGVR